MSSFIPRSRDETMACFHTCLNSVASALKSTDLVYIHYVSKENFTVRVKGFTCVSLVCQKAYANEEELSSLRLLRIRLLTNYSLVLV